MPCLLLVMHYCSLIPFKPFLFKVDFDDDDEGFMLNNVYIGCTSLVAFNGFTSSSESVNEAKEVSEGFLANAASRDYDGNHRLCRIVGEVDASGRSSNANQAVSGVVFPCKLDITDEYYVLILHQDFQVSAIDGTLMFVLLYITDQGKNYSFAHC
jgi:hypothetical protein